MNLTRCREFNAVRPSFKSSVGNSGGNLVGQIGSKYSCRNNDEEHTGQYFYHSNMKMNSCI